MNAKQRRVLERLAKTKATTISLEDRGPGEREDRASTKKTHKDPNGREKKQNQIGHGWHITERVGRLVGIVGKTAALLAALLGIVTGYLALLPRVSVSQGELLNPAETFSNPFIVSDDGPLPLEDVTFRCGLGEAKLENGPQMFGAPHFGSSFFILNKNGQPSLPIFHDAEMLPGERATIPYCSVPWTNPVENADIGIEVKFRIGYTFIHTTRTFQFVTRKDSAGNLHWFPDPLK